MGILFALGVLAMIAIDLRLPVGEAAVVPGISPDVRSSSQSVPFSVPDSELLLAFP